MAALYFAGAKSPYPRLRVEASRQSVVWEGAVLGTAALGSPWGCLCASRLAPLHGLADGVDFAGGQSL